MRILREEYGVKRLLLEGGATMNFEMLAAGCVDRLRVAVAMGEVPSRREARHWLTGQVLNRG